MARDEVDNHQVFEVVTSLSQTLAIAEDPDDPSDLETLHRARKVVEKLEKILQAADFDFLSTDTLNPILVQLNQAAPLAAAYSTAETYSQADLMRMASYLHAALDLAAPILVASLAIAPTDQREAANTFRRSAGQLMRSLTDESSEVSTQLRAVQAAAEEIKAEEEKRKAESATALDALRATIAAEQTRITDALSRLQTTFLDGETERRQAADEAVASIKSDAAAQAESLITNASDTIAELEKYRDDAAELVHAVGENTFARGFGDYATLEGRTADLWRLIAVVALGVVGALGVLYLQTVGDAEFTFQGFWIRAVIIIPFAFVAGYAASQSGRHRRNEVRARNLGLQLLALDPYLVLLDKEEADRKKLELAAHFFAPVMEDSHDKGDTLGLQQLFDLLSKALDKIPKP